MNKKEHDALSLAQVRSIGMAESEPNFLPDPLQDRLLETAIALGGELWVERERRARLEAVLISKGVCTREEIDSCVLPASEPATQQEQLSLFVKQLFGPLTTLPGENS